MKQQPFFSFDLRQPINQWLSIALICLMAFFVVLYYFVESAREVGTLYAGASSSDRNSTTSQPF